MFLVSPPFQRELLHVFVDLFAPAVNSGLTVSHICRAIIFGFPSCVGFIKRNLANSLMRSFPHHRFAKMIV